MKNSTKKYLTVKELADLLGISRVAVFKKIKNGQICAEKIGRNYIKLTQFNEAIRSLSNMIKKFPKSSYIKNSLFHIGIAFEMTKNTNKAIAYYNKVISIEPKDSINEMALKRLKPLKNN